MWFQQDGAPSHYSQVATAELKQQFGKKWSSCGGLSSSPLDFPI